MSLKRISLLVLLLSCLNSFGIKTINPILGDQSYFMIMGTAPTSQTDETIRITCHLLYVEHLLRLVDVNHLNEDQQSKRNYLLDKLHEYALRGEFPKNEDFPTTRKPCFIDSDGTICAVGYLVEHTQGIEVANAINEEYQYSLISEMDEDLITSWAEEYGLSRIECAMIQPTYDWKSTKSKSIEVNGLLSYRGLAQFTWGARIMYLLRSNFKARHFGTGIEFQKLPGNGGSSAIRFQGGFIRIPYVQPYLALNSEMYWMAGRNGFNLKPEIGFLHRYNFGKVYAHANLNYGYHFGLVNKENYLVGRHNSGFTLGIGFNL